MIAVFRRRQTTPAGAAERRHGELVLMRTPPDDHRRRGTGHLAGRVSILQATAAGEEGLATLVPAIAGAPSISPTLFCGVGPFALRLAAKSRIAAFDSDAGAVTALQKAATSTLGLSRSRPRPATCSGVH